MKAQLNLSDIMIMIFSVILVVTVFIVGANVVLDTSAKATGKSNLTYQLSVVTEKIMNSPCTTSGRGIFLEEKIKTASFDCLNISELYIRFSELSDEDGRRGDYYFEFKGRGSTSEIVSITPETYAGNTRFENGSVDGVSVKTPITVKKSSEEYYPGWMEVVVK